MKGILAFPRFRDIRQHPTARLIFLMSVGLVTTSLLFIVVAALALPVLLNRAVLISSIVVPVCLIILSLVRRSRLTAAGNLLVGITWLAATVGSISAGGISAPVFIGYLFVVALGGLVTNRQTAIFVAILSIGAGIVISIAETAGMLPAPIAYTPLERLSIYAFFFLLVLVLQIVMSGNTLDLVESARKSETKYQTLLENIPAVSYINANDDHRTTRYISPQVTKLLGYAQEEFVENPVFWKTILHPEDRERVLADVSFTFETGQPFHMEYRLITQENRIVWVSDDATLVRDEDSNPLHWLGVLTDISTRKQAEEEQANLLGVMTKRTIQLQTAAEVSRAITSILDINVLLPNVAELIRSHFDYYYVGIFLLDETRQWAQLCAATGDVGQQMLEQGYRLQVGESSMIGWCLVHRVSRIALDVGVDAVQFRNPLLPLTRSEMALPLIAHGEVIGAMTIQSVTPAAFSRVDSTALQSLADQVANAIENARLFAERASLIDELEGRNAELERFTYTVSHDLRSPLVTIHGFLGYLRRDAQSRDLARFDSDMERIAKAVDRMQALLNDLLELSRIGRITNPAEDIPLEGIVNDTLNLLHAQLETHRVRLKIQNDLPIVHCDRTRLIEIMQNLIGNAIKFMGDQPAPQIEIGSNGLDKDGKVILFVRDNGIGIEPRHHDRIFGLFNRLNPEVEGTGVGLTLVKRIVEVHGGRIWVESQPGLGSTFFLTLPMRQSSHGV